MYLINIVTLSILNVLSSVHSRLSLSLSLFLSHMVFMLRSWFKGHDTTVVMLWLEAVFAFTNEQNTTAYTRDIAQAIRGGNEFLRCLYKGGLWLSKDEAETAIRHSTTFCWS